MTKETSQLCCRQEWIDASDFLAEADDEVLNLICERVAEVVEGGKTPVVVFDLDSTLYEVQPRTFQIIQEYLASGPEAELGESVYQALQSLKIENLGYSMRDAFTNIGLDTTLDEVQDGLKKIGDFWWQRFFKDDYIQYDVAYPGAQAYVSRVYELGATLVYLTGRDFPNMGAGTLAAMKRDGFPVENERIIPMLKPEASMDDKKFKEEAITKIASLGTLVASFENEPANLVAMQKRLPKALHVFVETISSDHTCLPGKNLHKIKGFRS